MDVTKEVDRRLAAGAHDARWHGHLWENGGTLTADTAHRPQDLRVARRAGGSGNDGAGVGSAAAVQNVHGGDVFGAAPAEAVQRVDEAGAAASWQLRLQVGSAIALEARTAVKASCCMPHLALSLCTVSCLAICCMTPLLMSCSVRL